MSLFRSFFIYQIGVKKNVDTYVRKKHETIPKIIYIYHVKKIIAEEPTV